MENSREQRNSNFERHAQSVIQVVAIALLIWVGTGLRAVENAVTELKVIVSLNQQRLEAVEKLSRETSDEQIRRTHLFPQSRQEQK